MVRVEIDSIRVSLMSQDRVVVLKEVDSDRYLPIWIGTFEAEAIRVELQDVPVTRPLTHDLLKNAIQQLGGEVQRIVVSDLRNDIFFARIVVSVDDRTLEIDSRPSDAIALAVRVEVPIFVDDGVMDRAGIHPEEEVTAESEETAIEARKPGGESGEGDADPADISAFSEFLDTLDLDDLEDEE